MSIKSLGNIIHGGLCTLWPLRSFCCMAVPWLPLGAPLEGSWGTATRHGGVSYLGYHESVAKYRTSAPYTCGLSKCSGALKQWKLLSRIWWHFHQMSSEETHKLLPGTAACSRQGWATRGGQVQLDLFFFAVLINHSFLVSKSQGLMVCVNLGWISEQKEEGSSSRTHVVGFLCFFW